jgi:hypothetical protein
MRNRITHLLDRLESAKAGAVLDRQPVHEQGISLQIDVLRYALGYTGTNSEKFLEAVDAYADDEADLTQPVDDDEIVDMEAFRKAVDYVRYGR